jgi:phosphate-selective porin OprO and OprP
MTGGAVGTTSLLPLAVALCLLAPTPTTAGDLGLPLPQRAALSVSQEPAQDPGQSPDTQNDKKKKTKTAEEQAQKAEKKAEKKAAKEAEKDEVRMEWKTGPSLRLGRRGRIDFKLLLQGDLRSSDQDLEEAGGTFDLPRHQAGIKGNLFKVVEFEVMKEIGSDGPWRDVYVNARPISAVQVQAGKFKIPFSMDQLTARHSLDFVYRTLAGETLAPNRDTGVMVHGSVWNRFVRYQAGVFQGNGENSPSLEPPPLLPGELPDAPSKRSAAGRVRVRPLVPFHLPAYFESLEFGASAMRSEIPEGLNHLHGKTLFGTKLFPRQYYVNGARDRRSYDASWTPGPVSVRAEYIHVDEAREGVGSGDENGLNSTLTALPSTGWYVSGTWALTGEKKESGIEPRRSLLQGGFGAIEVAARYENIDFGLAGASQLPSNSPRAEYTLLGGEKILTLGVNWYANRFVKVQLNGIRETVDDPAASPIPGRASVWTLAFRFQWYM